MSVVAQRLARRLCDKCKRPTAHDEDHLAKIGLLIEEDEEVFEAVGCSACANTGYRGRIAVHEVMTVDEEIERLTVERSSASELGRSAVSHGMVSLRQDGWNKVASGLTSIEEILRVVA